MILLWTKTMIPTKYVIDGNVAMNVVCIYDIITIFPKIIKHILMILLLFYFEWLQGSF